MHQAAPGQQEKGEPQAPCRRGGGSAAPTRQPPPRARARPNPRGTPLAGGYAAAIDAAIGCHEAAAGVRLGALLMEPVLQGAGGMLCVDPAFQRALVEVRGRAGGVGAWV
jgi:dethiobiotin synthetase/adenosylmethionine--8-amino-7-oxononanoate aminotransferase